MVHNIAVRGAKEPAQTGIAPEHSSSVRSQICQPNENPFAQYENSGEFAAA
jgi:hypothetical protein